MIKTLLILPVACLVLTSCASVSIRNTALDPNQPPAGLPEKIYIRDFTTADNAFRVNRVNKDLSTMESGFSSGLTAALVERIGKHIAPAEAISATVQPPAGPVWLVSGRFERVNQGSRALRALFGWGAGGTKLETGVEVFDLSTGTPQRFLSFQTTGGSNAQPGLLTIPDPIGAPMAGISQATGTGLTLDAKRTSRMITATLSEYLQSRGIKPKSPLRVKRLGKLPVLNSKTF